MECTRLQRSPDDVKLLSDFFCLIPYFHSDFVPTRSCKSLQIEQTAEEVTGKVSRRPGQHIVKEHSVKGKGMKDGVGWILE